MSGCVDSFSFASGIYACMFGLLLFGVWYLCMDVYILEVLRLEFISGCVDYCSLTSSIYVWMCGFL